MSRVIRFAAWLLLAVWLPATLHCRMETAGLGETPHTSCCTAETAATDCLGDACANIEASLIKESAPAFNLAAPAGDCLFCFDAPVRAGCAAPALCPERHTPPLKLRVPWQFIQRAAPPARAPSLNA